MEPEPGTYVAHFPARRPLHVGLHKSGPKGRCLVNFAPSGHPVQRGSLLVAVNGERVVDAGKDFTAVMRLLASASFPLSLTFRHAPVARGVLEACLGTRWHRYYMTLSHGALRCYRREADAAGSAVSAGSAGGGGAIGEDAKHTVPLAGLQCRTNRGARQPTTQISLVVAGKVAGNDTIVLLLRVQAAEGAETVQSVDHVRYLEGWAAAVQQAVLFASGL